MKWFTDYSSNGFQLIELLVTLCILSILIGIASTNYSAHLIHANRLEAVRILEEIALYLEEYQLEGHTYVIESLEKLSIPDLKTFLAKKNYRIKLSSTSVDYLITATPLNSQAKRDECGSLSLGANGEKFVSGRASILSCWS